MGDSFIAAAAAFDLDLDALRAALATLDAEQLGWGDIQSAAFKVAADRGWHEPREIDGIVRDSSVGERLALIHSEVSEALEAYRRSGFASWAEVDGKPEGFWVELADVVIRVAEMAEREGVRLGEYIIAKTVFNATRPIRHGGKPL